jgi:hypothetical protein
MSGLYFVKKKNIYIYIYTFFFLGGVKITQFVYFYFKSPYITL